jgi:hypothetical protein
VAFIVGSRLDAVVRRVGGHHHPAATRAAAPAGSRLTVPAAMESSL